MASHSLSVPEHLLSPAVEFADEWQAAVRMGSANLRWSSVAFVGLARNCCGPLAANLDRLRKLTDQCGSWCLHIETNDNHDDTPRVLELFADTHEQASFRDRILNRQQYGAEFAGPRTIALAEYRSECQSWVADNAADTDYTIVIDFDAWGGWWHDGVLNGIGQMVMTPGAYGMASVSLMQHPAWTHDADGGSRLEPTWLQYDAWAFRWNTYHDAYTRGMGGWFHQWLPFVGSPPIRVCSAFGGMCIYRTQDYLLGTYDGRTDCEHTAFHRSIAERSGRGLFLNPSQRTIMRWVNEEPDDATRRDGND